MMTMIIPFICGIAYRQHYSSYTKSVESASLARARAHLASASVGSDLIIHLPHSPQHPHIVPKSSRAVSCADVTLSQFGAVLFISQSTLSRIKSRGKLRTRASSCSELDGNPYGFSSILSVSLSCLVLIMDNVASIAKAMPTFKTIIK